MVRLTGGHVHNLHTTQSYEFEDARININGEHWVNDRGGVQDMTQCNAWKSMNVQTWVKPGIDVCRTAVLCKHEETEELRIMKQGNNNGMGVVIKGIW
jgi:hypothetical protein